MKKFFATGLAGLALTAGLGSAEAGSFKTYGYGTLAAGQWEAVYWTDYVASSDRQMAYFGKTVDREGLWGHTFELEYGVTDRLTVAAYADFEQPDGEAFKHVQTRIVAARYRFGDYRPDAFNSAIYLEYYLPKESYLGKSKEKIELRLIFERSFDDWTLKLNPKFEKVVSGPDNDEGLEFEYAASLYREVGDDVEAGLELYGSIGEIANPRSWEDQRHYIVPAVTFEFGKHLEWNLGSAFGVTNGSDDVVIKSILEWKF
ncbi:hypothetical protein QVG61_01800 [Thiohalobacter sp. IOR34]|uniref:hypothetical protein n=1 Tax=Thiohalobacter sp. IOR34 TaxID=3057176 RepID=UPI0025AFC733|nr:hypothetical protein [Thiohalobacter sp. IOR34]WJW75847.1 hypothetical protein QVG61_01800 [Thiohalobacter sp. IOR34]